MISLELWDAITDALLFSQSLEIYALTHIIWYPRDILLFLIQDFLFLKLMIIVFETGGLPNLLILSLDDKVKLDILFWSKT